MINYMSWRIIDGKSRWIIVDENGNIVNRNPSKNELKDLDKEPYRQGNGKHRCNYVAGTICYRCTEKNKITNSSILRLGNAKREKDKDGNETGKWICNKCKAKYYNNLPDSYHNAMKSVANCRTGNLDPSCSRAVGNLFQELTCKWRSTVSIVPVEDLNKKLDNHRVPIDHSRDSILGIPQTKGCSYNSFEKNWHQGFNNEHNQIAKGFTFDVLILYCTSEYRNHIERLYIFPVEEITKRISITIYKNPRDNHGNPKTPWYEQYRVTDEETIKKVNDIWKKIIEIK